MTSPTYDPNIPLRTTPFADWQIYFQKNFQRLFTDFEKNHVSLTGGATAGNHTIIQMIEQSGNPQTGATEISVYTKDVPEQTDQVFMKYGNGTEFQFTNYQIYEIPKTDTQTTYFTFLPGKLIIYFGQHITPKFNSGKPLLRSIILNPPIARNIISVNITPEFSGFSEPVIEETSNNIIIKLNLSTLFSNPFGPFTLNYLVMANI
jgi:hypothetical protein